MPVQAGVSSQDRGALRLKEPGNSFTSITVYTFCATRFAVASKCIKLRTNKARDFARKISSSCPMHAFSE
jgi:hypothetical protein